MQESRLPPGGANKFQEIKRICLEAEKAGTRLRKLSIGQPSGPALESARLAASQAVLSEREALHEYQDNGSPGVPNFAPRFVEAHLGFDLSGCKVSFLPIPGIKPMLWAVPLACGRSQDVFVQTQTQPGYPTPADACKALGLSHAHLSTPIEKNFLWYPGEGDGRQALIMFNMPHNPTGQIATQEWWDVICKFAVKNDVRIFNDAAYTMLDHSKAHVSLAEVAIKYPDLSWAEAFSASKSIANGCGWRVGAMVGSPDFIADIATIKGNMDSGFVAFAAAGALNAVENDWLNIEKHRRVYEYRLGHLQALLDKYGMQPALEPKAGFFSLWKTPRKAFGQEIASADQFNGLMIQHAGIVGVPFDPFIRYAVTQEIEDASFTADIAIGFEKAAVEY